MNLTTKTKVQAFLSLDGGSLGQNEALLDAMISGISGRVESFLRRRVQSISRTVRYDVTRGMRMVQLFAYPVTSITSVHNSTDQVWDSSTLVASTDYVVDTETGLLHFKTPLSGGPQALQVIYTGGMGADTQEFVDAFPDLAYAVTQQIVEEYRRRNTIGANSVAVAGDSISYLGDVQMLPIVVQALERHRCWGELP